MIQNNSTEMIAPHLETCDSERELSESLATKVFVVGYPSHVGGADTELWHKIKLWRRKGIQVNLIPTWHASAEWRQRLDNIGVPTFEICEPDRLTEVPGLAGSLVVSFCNGEFLTYAHQFRQLDCQIVWVNCMTWVFPKELEHDAEHGSFDGYVFQSAFQRSCLMPQLAEAGVTEDHCFDGQP